MKKKGSGAVNEVVRKARTLFRAVYGIARDSATVFVPGRGEFMGIWADVYGGPMVTFCLPMGIAIVVSRRLDQEIICVSDQFPNDKIGFGLRDANPTLGWAHYIHHAIEVLSGDGYSLSTGLEIAIASDLPVGAGLSSSSALTTGFVMALNEIMSLGLSRFQIADVACRAEWKVTKGGNKDQMVIANATKDNLFYMRSLMLSDGSNYDYEHTETRHIAWPSEYALAIVDTGTRRKMADCQGYIDSKELALSAYDKINRWRCQEGLCEFGYPAEVSLECLEEARLLGIITENEYLRLSHPVTDKLRIDALLDRPIQSSFGQLISAQESLRRYGIGSPVFDRATQLALFHGALGACQIGAGYAGCIVAVIECTKYDTFRNNMLRSYCDTPGANVYVCTPSSSAILIP